MINKTKEYYSDVSQFFNDDNANGYDFFMNMHKKHINKLFNKLFYFKMEEMYKMWGKFKYENYFDCEEQYMRINSFNDYKNLTYKKALQLITFIHEETHAKQRDYYVYHNSKDILEENEYNKMLNLEIFCNTEATLCTYEQLLTEHDAIHTSVMEFYELLENNTIPKTTETLSVILYACVRYFASLNGEKHHTYCPEKFGYDCDKLIEYYKDFYTDMIVKFNSYSKPLSEVISSDEFLTRLKKNEIQNVNFDKIKPILNKKTEKITAVMNNVFRDMISLYEPSKQILEYLNISKKQWQNTVEKNNIVKLSALICEDLHSTFTNSTPLIMKQNENEL